MPPVERSGVLPAVVARRSRDWIRIALESFHHHIPDLPVLVVDHNDDPGGQHEQEERAWVAAYEKAILIEDPQPRLLGSPLLRVVRGLRRTTRYVYGPQHGAGIDCAIRYAIDHGYRYLVLFDPDCLITGSVWFDRLLSAVEAGAWYAGSDVRPYGPIHCCPAILDLESPLVEYSARMRPRGADERHPRFRELVDMKALNASTTGDRRFWRHYWDTIQKIWFEAAVRDRATAVRPSDDFTHFWRGTSEPDPRKHEMVRRYLQEASIVLPPPAVYP